MQNQQKVVIEGIQDEHKKNTNWEELKEKDQAALQLLCSAVSEEILSDYLFDTKTSKDAWDVLKLRFEEDSKGSVTQAAKTNNQQESSFTGTHDQDEIDKDIWVIDSRATSHMVNDKSWFTELGTNTRAWLNLGSGEIVQTQGKGTVSVITESGKRNMKDVLLVPSLTHNYLSVQHMMENGCKVMFKELSCIITNQEGKQILEAPMSDGWYCIKFEKPKEEGHKEQKKITRPEVVDKGCEDAESVKLQKKEKEQSLRCVTVGLNDLTENHETQGNDTHKQKTGNETKKQEVMNDLLKCTYEGESANMPQKKHQPLMEDCLKPKFINQQVFNPSEGFEKKVYKLVGHQTKREKSEIKGYIHDEAKVRTEKSLVTIKRETELIDGKCDDTSQRIEKLKTGVKEDTKQRDKSLAKKEQWFFEDAADMGVKKGNEKQEADVGKAHETARQENNNGSQNRTKSMNTRVAENHKQIEEKEVELPLRVEEKTDFSKSENQYFDPTKCLSHKTVQRGEIQRSDQIKQNQNESKKEVRNLPLLIELKSIERELGDKNSTQNNLQEKDPEKSVEVEERQREGIKCKREIEIRKLSWWDEQKIIEKEIDMNLARKHLHKREVQVLAEIDINQRQIDMGIKQEERLISKENGEDMKRKQIEEKVRKKNQEGDQFLKNKRMSERKIKNSHAWGKLDFVKEEIKDINFAQKNLYKKKCQKSAVMEERQQKFKKKHMLELRGSTEFGMMRELVMLPARITNIVKQSCSWSKRFFGEVQGEKGIKSLDWNLGILGINQKMREGVLESHH
ncbi:PREDICTED: trichohyalin-like [Camelina sativa]|uniref:Trichohyalin-like n=1 Tax=Camelina sativa TaxID=90675 RepID=A0ABM0X5S9_CAMSA|nr:PREDICTED: trichohyalin-like [Camelina sativa]